MAELEEQVAPAVSTGPTSESRLAAEELLELLRRERADFLNYKRRVERERVEDRKRALEEVVERLLPLLDELDRALAQVPSDLETHPWAQGVALSRQRLADALRELGVERIGVAGEPFDPAQHEAVFYDERPDAIDQRVSAITRAGYRLGERLLRPAQVAVVGPAEAARTATSEATGLRDPHPQGG